jgi:hypothetical protein
LARNDTDSLRSFTIGDVAHTLTCDLENRFAAIVGMWSSAGKGHDAGGRRVMRTVCGVTP